jgi:hypothetical protein
MWRWCWWVEAYTSEAEVRISVLFILMLIAVSVVLVAFRGEELG